MIYITNETKNAPYVFIYNIRAHIVDDLMREQICQLGRSQRYLDKDRPGMGDCTDETGCL